MDWTITVTITTLVLAFITAVGVWLGPRWTENTHRGYEARQSHLTRLKDDVIRPLLLGDSNKVLLHFLTKCYYPALTLTGTVGLPAIRANATPLGRLCKSFLSAISRPSILATEDTSFGTSNL